MVLQHSRGMLYGCTFCQDACPFNQKTVRGVDCELGQLPAVMDTRRIVETPDDELKKLFSKTALGGSWLCPSGIKRTAAISVYIEGTSKNFSFLEVFR
jgi:epoxyqueuosine reductase QueG